MTAPVREGEILAGKYRVDRVLGVGGMGVVVAAHHLELDDRVAIKFLLPETLGNAEAVARFAREARAAVKIKSEHVARVSDVGKLENGAPYMVMEHLEGSDLSAWLTERGPLPPEQAVEFTLQASEAIAEAHSLGIVHRDLKPANLFVIRRPDGGLSIKVLDFGISKMTSLTGSGADGSMTKTSTMMGSPIYMSPEQIQSSKDVDARGDIWALGVILYELITGSPPFGGEHIAELIFRIISSPPPRMQAYRPETPAALEAVILRCLEKDRSRRFQSISEMANALAPFAPRRALGSIERITGVATGRHAADAAETAATSGAYQSSHTVQAGTSGAGTSASWGTTATPKSRGPWLLVAAGALVALAVGAFTVVRLNGVAAAPSASHEPPLRGLADSAPPAVVLPKSEPSAPPPALVPVAASAASASAATPISSVAPSAAAPSARSTANRAPIIKPKPPSTATHVSDPWGGSQH